MKTSLTIAVVVAIVLSALNIVLGPLNQDEGWYLLAGLNTAHGMVPYRDFMFSQSPVLPYVYAILSPIWADFGVLGGRVLTALMGLGSAAFFSAFAWRIAPPRSRDIACLCTWLLTACCPVFNYFTVIPKTYALSGLFVAAAFFTLSGTRSWRFEVGGILLALSAGTRLSLGVMLAVVGLGLLFNRHQVGLKWGWLRLGLGGGLTLLAIFVPFMVLDNESFVFSLTCHAGRTNADLMKALMLRAGFVSRLMQGYFLIPCVAGFAVLFGLRRSTKYPLMFWLAAVSFLAVTAVHLTAPFPYDDYQTPVMPLAAAGVAVMMASAFVAESGRCHRIAEQVLVGLAILFIGASPLCMNWVALRQDRFWFEMKKTPELLQLREVGAWLRERTEPGDTLLTQDAYLAVEARLKVLPGLEMGPFSIFPALDDEVAAKFNVHNLSTLSRAIRNSKTEYAALSGYSFAIACPSTDKIDANTVDGLYRDVASQYGEVKTVPDFGQNHTTLQIWQRNP